MSKPVILAIPSVTHMSETRRARLEALHNRGEPKMSKRRGAGYTRKMRKGRSSRP